MKEEIMGQEELNGGGGWEGSLEELVWITNTKDL